MLEVLLYLRYNSYENLMINSINNRYPLLEKFDSHPDYGDYKFKDKFGVSSYIALRNKAYEKSITTEDKLKAGIGAILGTSIPLFFMMKKQKTKNPFNLKYGLGNMVALSASSIAGGVACAMAGETKETRKNKAKEGLFQFLNASIPAWTVAGSLKLCETSRKFNNIPSKALSLAGGLLVGMYGAAALSNLICDPKDKYPDRKLTLKDCLINIDDALGVLILAKFPLVEKLNLQKFLPVLYTYCGYRAGKSN